jgi:hypothetical protein
MFGYRGNQASSPESNLGERRAVRRQEQEVPRMYALMVFVVLALGLAVIADVLREVLPVKLPDALAHTTTVLVAIGICWAIDYSVFEAFGQALRTEWMNPVATGIALVGTAEFLRAVVGNLGLNISIGGRGKTA